ncbi:MAG: ribulose-phosphate 3-epimerase [bacterium]|nr:ribulose-phosphate 3-epimerase [bacterium]
MTKTRPIRIAPSLLSANFASLAEEIRKVEEGGADLLHIDVMDGHFVPNITIGPPVVQSLRAVTKTPLDVHLMIEHPEDYFEEFRQAGADILTIHWEVCHHLHRSIQVIKEKGMRAGIAINPSTPVQVLECMLSEVDQIVIMSVNPGFGGQRFIPFALSKIRTLRQMISQAGLDERVDILVDGGIKLDNCLEVIQAGANIIVLGSGIFYTSDPAATVRKVRGLIEMGVP